MRPNASSGCCALENVANTPALRSLPPYPLTATAHLHSHLPPHPHQQQAQQQQQKHHRHQHQQQQQQHLQHQHHFHAPQHLVQQQQAFNHWLPQQNLYPPNAHKSVGNGRHQALSFATQSTSTLNQNQNQQQQHQQLAPTTGPHSHPQHQYHQYLGGLQSLHQQSTHAPHHFNGYTSASQPRSGPPPEQLNSNTATAAATHSHNFPKLSTASVINPQRIHECAGIPLISNASTHLTANQRQRVQRKLSRSPVPHQKLATTVGGVEQTYNVHHPTFYMTRNSNAASCSQISQLAAHAQGAPLLLHKQQQQQQLQQNAAQKWSMPNNVSNGFPSTSSAGNVKSANGDKPTRSTLRYQHSAPAALSTRGKENSATHAAEEIPTVSETPKENTDSGETALPRIIKPRKRRKKDRKPATNGIFLKLDAISSAATAAADKECKAAQGSGLGMSQLFSRQHQQLQQQMYLNTPEDANENHEFINFYIGHNQAIEQQGFTSNPQHSNYKPRSLLQSACIKSNNYLNGVKITQCDDTQDKHGICFCSDCDPLRSIWDYPLRRSLSDSSTASARTHSDSSSTSSSTSASPSHASSTEASSSSCCSSTPLTDSAISPTAALSRADRVGVIGSNRNVPDSNRDATKRTDTLCDVYGGRTATNGCLSDSNDSGYGDILSGINIADDFFSQSAIHQTNAAQLAPLFEAATTDMGLSAAGPTSSSSNRSIKAVGATLPPLLPATADALLTESINEISRKLIETCGSELSNELVAGAATRSTSVYSRCSSDFSTDSGIDSAAIVNCDELVFKFDNLQFMFDPIAKCSINDDNNNNSSSSINSNAVVTPKTGNEEQFLLNASNMNILFDVNNNNNNKSIYEFESENERQQLQQSANEKHQQQQQQHDQQFINNCFDLVWPTTFEHCIRETATKILDLDVNKQLGALSFAEIA